jgi:hypothetical protein
MRISLLSRNGFFSSYGLFCLLLASAVLIVAGDDSRDESNEDLNADDSKPQVVTKCMKNMCFVKSKYVAFSLP